MLLLTTYDGFSIFIYHDKNDYLIYCVNDNNSFVSISTTGST